MRPDRMAHPSAGSDPDHHGRLRARAELGWSGQSDSTGRRHLVPAGREALAWRDAEHRHDPHRNPGTPPRQGRRLDGEGQRRTIPGACRRPEVVTPEKGESMRGAVLYAPRDVRCEEREDPRITKPTDAIIRMSATCVCGSDLWPYRGIEPLTQPTPFGHEYCGIVEEVGSAVESIRPGQFVIGSFFASDNTCT